MAADQTGISWTDSTWNPVTGCSKVSEGCRYCYAEALSLRFGWSRKPWAAEHAAENVVCHPDRLTQPLRWHRGRKVFVNSMSDLFHERVPDAFIADVFAVMVEAPQHIYQILTKRPARLERFARDFGIAAQPYIWLGVSAEDQRAADERIPLLLQTPAAVHFVSCEPLLGTVDLSRWLPAGSHAHAGGNLTHLDRSGRIDWVICGGESGPHARPMALDWARSLRAQCAAAGVPFFLKQLGGVRPGGAAELDGREWHELPEPEEVAR